MSEDMKAEAYVTIVRSKGPFNMHNVAEMKAWVWQNAYQMAQNLYTTCDMGNTGHGGLNHIRVPYGEARDLPFLELEVRVGKNLGKDKQGNYHKPVSVYMVRRGGGLPTMWSPSRLLAQSHSSASSSSDDEVVC